MGHASPRDGESSAQDLEQQMAAEKRQKERSSKAHKKEEARRKAEEEKLNKERQDMNEELKIAQENASADAEKKLLKMRRKYDKKVKALRSEIDDLHEVSLISSFTIHVLQEFELEREQLLETIREQNKETRLFQEICRAVLDEKRLKQLIERCRYEEDTDEWIIPYIKQRDVDLRLPEISNNATSNRTEAKGTRTRPPSGNDAETRQAAAVAESKSSRRPGSRSAQDDSRVPSARGREPTYLNTAANNRDAQSISPVMNGNPQIQQQPPTKPPKSARRDKKPKAATVRQPLASPQDEIGTGEEAGSVSEWGFAPTSGDTGIALCIEGAGVVGMDNAMISLNHQPAMGDRQSSRQGGRRKKSSHDSKRGKV